ncbi:MAG: crossover junction endodeoxyribonuclease RuvC [Rikenellaceae bacterium]|nr:crossover junction endodeoxyribonuclease RuvC [Rikenellaceae bacterium]MDE7356258.1 crossover junction endodeoxyribonuclease RuvC [Rikenellaceae bacterium]
MADRIIMGIDPGTNKMGYGVIRICGRRVAFVTMGYIDLSKFKTPYLKLGHIYERVSSLVAQYKPDAVALEAPFFGDNVQSMLKLGRAQGVAIAAASVHCSEIFEYAPRKVKIAVTGSGGATKEQVADMLKHILSLKELPANLDSTDGLAVALCHHLQEISPIPSSSRSGGWDDFIARNPDRVK